MDAMEIMNDKQPLKSRWWFWAIAVVIVFSLIIAAPSISNTIEAIINNTEQSTEKDKDSSESPGSEYHGITPEIPVVDHEYKGITPEVPIVDPEHETVE